MARMEPTTGSEAGKGSGAPTADAATTSARPAARCAGLSGTSAAPDSSAGARAQGGRGGGCEGLLLPACAIAGPALVCSQLTRHMAIAGLREGGSS
jgi:hypothetical protein